MDIDDAYTKVVGTFGRSQFGIALLNYVYGVSCCSVDVMWGNSFGRFSLFQKWFCLFLLCFFNGDTLSSML